MRFLLVIRCQATPGPPILLTALVHIARIRWHRTCIVTYRLVYSTRFTDLKVAKAELKASVASRQCTAVPLLSSFCVRVSACTLAQTLMATEAAATVKWQQCQYNCHFNKLDSCCSKWLLACVVPFPFYFISLFGLLSATACTFDGMKFPVCRRRNDIVTANICAHIVLHIFPSSASTHCLGKFVW